ATALAFTTQPGNGTAGSALSTQPVIKSQDAFGNNSTVGLGPSVNVTLSLSVPDGMGLKGTTNLDIGTGAGNGTVAFSSVEVDSTGAKQLLASAPGLSSATSSSFNVGPAAAVRLAIQTQPPSTVAAAAT